ncbi:putative quinol monooxygenase [Massilia sp. YIM B02763]|uniref:putative quinol monooxygenase n=1 Tax=Massilia sp. YIM B02763 TaxID=3050130 RepID=UPI0025B72104|nr:putative quinol monooxygenase [Massilia sp. YIM B02763]MDN4053086.1 putative quinol monooxygenase [Massilia sp. YIM B02763]
MPADRRDFMIAVAATGAAALSLPLPGLAQPGNAMYGLIGKMRTAPGKRDAVVALLLEGTKDMPGCRSYIVARDPADADAIWITEAWDSKESHKASLALPGVQKAIGQARPMIAGFGERFETMPVGGQF